MMRIGLPTLTIVAVCLSAAMVRAQDDVVVSPGQHYFDQAREHYGDRHYAEAIPFLIQAIQADPVDPRYYRGLARAAHFAEDFDRAVYFYDLYITFFADHAAQERSRSNRLEAIQSERDRANTERATPDQPASLNQTQAAALQAVESRLASGPLMALDRSGAYSMFQALLRTGYAHPHLGELRSTLRDGILEETHAMFSPNAESPVPIAVYDDWRFVYERYRAVEELGAILAGDLEVEARKTAAQGQIDLINANYDTAAERFAQAVEQDPNLALAYWGLIRAHHGIAMNTGSPVTQQAEQWLVRLEELTRFQAPQHLPLLAVARCIVYSDMGRHREASAALIELLAPGHDTGVVIRRPEPEPPPPTLVHVPTPLPTSMPSPDDRPVVPEPMPLEGELPPSDL